MSRRLAPVKRKWRLIAALLAGFGTIAAGSPVQAPVAALQPDTLILFVASWCAPCRIELARADAIAVAARPRRMRIVPLDKGQGTTAMLRKVRPDLVWNPDKAEMQALETRLLTQTAGLPFSAMTDDAGKPCALHRAILDTAAVAVMRKSCPATVAGRSD